MHPANSPPQDLKTGGSHVHIVPPQETVLRRAPASYPVILRSKRLRACAPGGGTSRGSTQPISGLPPVNDAGLGLHSNHTAAGMAAASEPGSATATDTGEAALASSCAVNAASVSPAAEPLATSRPTRAEPEATAGPAAASAVTLQVQQVPQQPLSEEGEQDMEEDEGSDMPDLGFA